MNPALVAIREATKGTPFEGRVWLVGGCVRDPLLGRPEPNDLDLVTEGDATDLARLLFERGVSSIPPVIYPRFGTALVRVEGASVELATARRESYETASRKPHIEPASLREDALRRDFTINALLRNLHSGELLDPLGVGLADLEAKALRTPLEPGATFRDDPLRMLRAVRFRWTLGFEPVPGLYEAIRQERRRLEIVSGERIRDEFVRMLDIPDADRCMGDLMELGLFDVFAPELCAMCGVEQGGYHYLDVWQHTLLVLRNAAHGDRVLKLAALFHDVGKPATRTVGEDGRTRFFGHEVVGAEIAGRVMRRLKFPSDEIARVALLVKNHMRLTSAPEISPSAARRLVRDLGEDVDRLLDLVEADAKGLKPGVTEVAVASARRAVEEARKATPADRLQSPLSGDEIKRLLGLQEGPEVGRLKRLLEEKVLEGELAPGDKLGAETVLRNAALQKRGE